MFAGERELAEMAGDASSQMKRRILKKKRKGGSPVVKPMAAGSRTLSELESEKDRTIVELNEEIEKEEAISDEQFRLKLDSEDSNEPSERVQQPQVANGRKSVAFVVTPQTRVVARTPARKSIAPTDDTDG